MNDNSGQRVPLLFAKEGGEATFLGLPRCENLDALDADVAIIGVPCATPYPHLGAYSRNAPAAIRSAVAGYAAALGHVDFDFGEPLLGDGRVRVVDCGDLDCDEADAEGNRQKIEQAVRTITGRGAVPIVIGGDDSVPVPVFRALERDRPFTILQIDAHIDWREEVGGERFGLSSTMRRASELGSVERIIQVGQRAIGSARPDDLRDGREWGVTFVSARSVYDHGVGPVLEAIPQGSDVYVTLDCDALDPAVMPGVLARAPGGLDHWQTLDLIHGAAKRGRLIGFNIVELVPEADIDSMGALVAARIVANVIGRLCRQA